MWHMGAPLSTSIQRMVLRMGRAAALRGRRLGFPVIAVLLTLAATSLGILSFDSQSLPATSPPSAYFKDIAAQKAAEGGTPTPTPIPSGGVHYDGLGIDIVPVTDGTTAKTTGDQAIAVLSEQSPFTTTGEPPSATLALASDGNFGQSEGSKPSFSRRLSWIVTYPDTPMVITGAPRAATEQSIQKLKDANICANIGIIDAITLAPLSYFQWCVPR